MGGIVFFKTRTLDKIKDFYQRRIGMAVWLEQKDCVILKFENLLLGFCQSEESETQGIITFYYENTDQVYGMYKKFRLEALGEPVVNEKYNIYHFFIKDPEGRTIEFQCFLNYTQS
jgi:catechol-2,3-dioxygenase|uniref:VOC family protein n=1 Tax=candidate division WOR-3 bacterium TaxID=2052148 RepID=A0A7V3RHQ8_UNCW3